MKIGVFAITAVWLALWVLLWLDMMGTGFGNG